MQRVGDDVIGLIVDVKPVYDEVLASTGALDIADFRFLGIDQRRELSFDV